MNREKFSSAAGTAIKHGRTARKELAELHARNFVDSPHDFDPRKLAKLRSYGIKRFIEIVQESGTRVTMPRDVSVAQPAPSSQDQEKPSAIGWKKMQCSEPRWRLIAIFRGTLFGTAFFLCGLAVLAKFTL